MKKEKKIFFGKEFEYGGTIGNLDENKGNYSGVYIISLPNDKFEIEFDENHYKAKCRKNGKEIDLNYTLGDLEQKWVNKVEQKLVNDTKVLYIGKSASKTVQKRMIEHIRLYTWDEKNKGYNNVPARGGRSVGQIKNFKALDVWYLKCDNPDVIEKDMLKLFKNKYHKRPFANRRD